MKKNKKEDLLIINDANIFESNGEVYSNSYESDLKNHEEKDFFANDKLTLSDIEQEMSNDVSIVEASNDSKELLNNNESEHLVNNDSLLEDNDLLNSDSDSLLEDNDLLNLDSDSLLENNEVLMDENKKEELNVLQKDDNEKSYNIGEYSLELVFSNSPLQELEYIQETKARILSQEKFIEIKPKMGFFKKRRAIKYNAELTERLEQLFLENYNYVQSIRETYKIKFDEYVREQNKYRESLFKL